MTTLAIVATLAAAFVWTALPGALAYVAARLARGRDEYDVAEATALAVGAAAFIPWSLFGLWVVGAA